MDGNPMLIFALMWQIVRMKLTIGINLLDHPELYRILEEGETIEQFNKLPPEQKLLRWFNYHLKKAKHPRLVHNFSGDVRDSECYTVLLHQLNGQLCSLQPLQETDEYKRAECVLTNSEKLGCKRFITPSDINSGNQKLNLSFVANLFNTCPGLEELTEVERAEKLKILLEEENSAENKEER